MPTKRDLGQKVETLDASISLSQRIWNWGAPVVSLVAPGGVAYLWAIWSQIPAVVAGVIALYAAGGALWVYNGVHDLRVKRQAAVPKIRPNYEAWDHVENLMLKHAANLWAEVEATSSATGPGYPYLKMLKEQAYQGAIKATQEHGMYTMDSEITREELKKLAVAKGMRPLFLYPEDRKP
jgi:hypothetical protein